MKSFVSSFMLLLLLVFFSALITMPVYGQFDDLYEYTDDEDSEEVSEVEEPTVEETPPVVEPEPTPEPQENLFADEPPPAPTPTPAPVTPAPQPSVAPVVAEEPQEAPLFSDEKVVVEEKPEPKQEVQEADVYKTEYEYVPGTGRKSETKKSLVPNAILEGIQLSSEPGATPDENIITCYFIFRDKPTSYFYESNVKEKTISFEFNDVVLGSSPIPSQDLPPISKFKIRQQKVDANREVVGLKPEWHDVVVVTFTLEKVPQISVKDEYSVISYSFNWSNDPGKQKGLVAAAPGLKHPGWFWGSVSGGVLAAGGAGLYLFLNREEEGGENGQVVPQEIPINDLPVH